MDYKCIASNPQFIVNGFVHRFITKALDGNFDSDREDDVSKCSTQNTSEDFEPASDTENVLDTGIMVVEGDYKDVEIEDITVQSTDHHEDLNLKILLKSQFSLKTVICLISGIKGLWYTQVITVLILIPACYNIYNPTVIMTL